MTIMYSLIKNTAPNTFNKGKELYKKGKFNVNNFILIEENGEKRYFNVYQGTQGSYHQFLSVKNDEIVDLSCTCPAFFEWGGYCKHCVAMGFSVLNENLKEEKESLDFERIIEKKDYKNASLVPYFSRYNDQIYLNIKIDLGKEYIIRSISEFIESVKYEYDLKFGKIPFTPNISYFDDLSKELIYLLMDFSDLGKEIAISDTLFDRLFDIYRGRKVNFNINKLSSVNFMLDDYDIKLRFKDSQILMDDLYIIEGFKNNYCLIDDNIYRISKIDDDLKKLYKNIFVNKKLSIRGNEKKFFKRFLPKMDNIEVSYDDMIKYQGDRIDIDTYLDYDLNVKLTKKVFVNGILDEDYNDLEDEVYQSYLKLLDDFKFKNDEITDTLDIVEFLTADLTRFNEFGVLYKSSAFDSLEVKKPQGFGISVSFGIDLLEVNIENDLTNEEITKILQAYKKKKKFVKVNGQILDIENIENIDIISDLNLNEKNILGTHSLDGYNIFKLKKYLKGELLDVIEKFNHLNKLNYPINDNLKGKLRDYQMIGFNWLNLLDEYHFGGILADDMGLGKTLQIISLIESSNSNLPSIIVCPSSLIFNWLKEINKWGFFNATVINGSKSDRSFIIDNMKDGQIYITSYDSLRRDINLYKHEFKYVIADEAQFIKNNNALKTKALKKLNGQVKYALTGTPIENRLADLWSIFDFILPNYLSSYESFKENYETPIFMGDKDALKSLIKKITPFVLRRCKKDVLKELPPRIDEVIYVNMQDEHRKLYDSYLLDVKRNVQSFESKIEILALLTRLRQLCCEPRMFLENYDGVSSKLEMAMSLISEGIENGHKILLFSQFTSCFEYISERLINENIKFDIIKGDTKPEKRLELVEKFNSDDSIKVMLISLKAGGTGLNLIGADMVIHFDPWWNVSAENQATDRTHRIGQTRSVTVFKLICSNTIEQRVLELQGLKKNLSDSIISDEMTNINKLSKNDIKYLLD